MKLAAVQYRPPKGDPITARFELVELVTDAAKRGAELIVAPEMATCGYVWDNPEELMPHAEFPQGPTFKALAKVAKRYRVWIVVGIPEVATEVEEGREVIRLYNSALVINAAGRLSACYRKVALFELDLSWATPGARRYLLQTGFAHVGVGICMDLNDDRFIQWLNLARVNVLAFSANWIDQGEEVIPYWQWRLSPWNGWLVAANTYGNGEGLKFRGESAILAPGGSVVAKAATSGDDVVYFDTASL